MIVKNDRVVLRKDVTYSEVEIEKGEKKEKPRSKKGEVSRVLRVFPGKRMAIVEGVNYRKKAVRPTQDNPRGGWVSKEMPIDLSNVSLYCPECHRGVRARRIFGEGKARRVCRRCGTEIPLPSKH
ncbi:MAG: 50S ribosomal protein L24 [Planctomycetes bacterium]|nr:50S ribosomal protein L24 [Planctomycetota bacterium]